MKPARIVLFLLPLLPLPLVAETQNHALHFDGLNDKVEVDRFPQILAAFTIEARVRRTRPTDQWADTIVASDRFRFQIYPDNSLEFWAVSSSPNFDVGRAVRHDGQWAHVAVVWDGGSVVFYLDGVPHQTAERTGAAMTISRLRIGHDGLSGIGGLDAFDGDLDEVRFWGRARTASEIRQMMNTTLAAKEDGLIGYWRFDEGFGQVASDSSRSQANGFLGDTPADDPGDPRWSVVTDKGIVSGQPPSTASAEEPPGAGAPPTRGPTSAAELVQMGKELEKRGDLEAALGVFHRALFLTPGDKAAAAKARRLSAEIARGKTMQAKEALKSNNKAKAVALLMASYEIYPARETTSMLARLGYTRHLGCWRAKDEIRAFETAEVEREKKVRAELGLGAEFRQVRTDHLRVFTNMPKERQWDKWLDPVLEVTESLCDRYQWLFTGEVDAQAMRDGLNVVIFAKEEEYKQYLQRIGTHTVFRTAGLYDRNRRVTLFFRQPGYTAMWPVVIHELTHHLSHEVLHSAYLACIGEGLAEYFAGGVVERDFTLTIGRPNYSRLLYLRSERVLETKYVPAERIFTALGMGDAVLAGVPPAQAYAQMWGWVYFLLHSNEARRTLLLECIRAERGAQMGGGLMMRDPRVLYREIFAKHGMPMVELDELYREFLRGLPLSGKSPVRR